MFCLIFILFKFASYSHSLSSYLSLFFHSNRNTSFKRILDRIIFTTMTGNLNSVDSVAYIPNNKSASNQTVSSSAQQSKIIDQISLNCKINKLENISEEDLNNNYYYLESELRSTVLQLALLDVHMSQLPEGAREVLLLLSSLLLSLCFLFLSLSLLFLFFYLSIHRRLSYLLLLSSLFPNPLSH